MERKREKLQCSVTNQELGKHDVIENSVKVGDRTVLFLPSIHSLQKLHPISSQVDFNVIERTNLTSLSESNTFSYSSVLSFFTLLLSSITETLIQVYFGVGLILGTPYIVSPSTCHETEALSEEMDQPDLNTQSKHSVSLRKPTLQ